ncbi:MAG: BMP family ABC transporter substrate-binding protein [Treponema sp.]|jgi:simple sugar transport system substrate-binding protein|nr:BMP family ABC transporter substrate-binding protein [Treponema sp.]
MKKIAVMLLMALALFGCRAKDSKNGETRPFSLLVYITGVVAGSPPYELLAAGAEEFAAAHSDAITVKIYEAGFNQAEWEEQLTSMVAGGEYDLVLGSNPSLPEICVNVGKKFPNQKFIITDAFYEGNSQISTWLYNQYEQSLYLGYLAGLVTVSDMIYANAFKRIGFIAAQEYPLLSRHIVPGFLEGARRVDSTIELDFRVIGNWFDANKAADLASGMVDSGVDVFASIAGGAAQGMIQTMKERGAYAVFYNTNEYNQAPGLVLGCGRMEQKKLVKEILADVLAGNIQYGTAKMVGAQEGYLDFITDDSGYRDYVPAGVQEQFNAFMEDIRAGRIEYTVPPL